jgi:AcrR family transcriptional regulator
MVANIMTDQLAARDWLDQGLKALAASGHAALKAEPLAKAMGVSRGSFYWHFADIGAFHAAILKHWREVAAEQIIANVEAAAKHENPLPVLLRQAFSGKLALEKAVRSWATFDTGGDWNMSKACSAPPGCRTKRRRRGRKSSIGPFSAPRSPTSRCQSCSSKPYSTNY